MKTIALSTMAIFAISTISVTAENVDLGDISITATKTKRKVSDVPASIEVITQKRYSEFSC